MGSTAENLHDRFPAGEPNVRYGLTTMCAGLGMGGTVLWENLNA